MTTAVRAYTLAGPSVVEGGSNGGSAPFPTPWTAVPFTATRFDQGSFWAAGSPTRLTIPTTGYYRVGGLVSAGDPLTQLILWTALRVNGSTWIAVQSARNGTAPVVASCGVLEADWHFTVGDYVELLVSEGNARAFPLLTAAAYSAEAWVALMPNAGDGARVTATVSQAMLGSPADTAVIFSTVAYDDASYFSLVHPTRLTIPTTGLYHVMGELASTGDYEGNLYLLVNGTTRIAETFEFAGASTAAPVRGQVSAIWSFAAGDYVELFMTLAEMSWSTDVATYPPSFTIVAL